MYLTTSAKIKYGYMSTNSSVLKYIVCGFYKLKGIDIGRTIRVSQMANVPRGLFA